MRFWKIKMPDYDCESPPIYINGLLEHPFILPGIRCDVCGESWGGSRILPYQCPKIFQQNTELTTLSPIHRSEHEALQKKLLKEILIEGDPFVALRPGDRLQPCYLDVPSRPRADFLWSTVGSLVVSERIKNVLVECCGSDIAVSPVTNRKIGKWETHFIPPRPSTGESEDLINEVPLLKDTSRVGPYFEIIILNESGYPPGGTPKNICSGCRRPDVDNTTRQIRMTQEMWRGHSIFHLATTLYVIFTDTLREKMKSLSPTNIVFEEI
jgi:hypothetical protein